LTDGVDTIASQGAVVVLGSVLSYDGSDALLFQGTALVAGSANVLDLPDTVASLGRVLVSGSMSVTDAADTLVATSIEFVVPTPPIARAKVNGVYARGSIVSEYNRHEPIVINYEDLGGH
jgi:hypothetical protein